MSEDYTPLHERYGDDATVQDVADMDTQDVTKADVRRRMQRAQDAVKIYLRDLTYVRAYLEGDLDEDEVWAKVRGLASGGITGEDVDVVQHALHTLQRRAERVRRLTSDAVILRRIERALADQRRSSAAN
jgi:hypothetical protein